jgi:hypothetical protein
LRPEKDPTALQRYKESFEKNLALIKKYDDEYEELVKSERKPEVYEIPNDSKIEVDAKYHTAFDDFNASSIRECGPGWQKIIETFCSLLNERNERADSAKVYIQRIVGKFGSLRILARGRVPEIENWVNFAERQSSKTCEVCGQTGQLISDAGWQRTRCGYHKNRPLDYGE